MNPEEQKFDFAKNELILYSTGKKSFRMECISGSYNFPTIEQFLGDSKKWKSVYFDTYILILLKKNVRVIFKGNNADEKRIHRIIDYISNKGLSE